MSYDTYQPIYDAVRSKIHEGNIGDAVRGALPDFSHYAHQCQEMFRMMISEYERPFVICKPKMMIDGEHWCALYGEDLQNGVAGYGKSPSDASYAFDKAWYEKLPTPPANGGGNG